MNFCHSTDCSHSFMSRKALKEHHIWNAYVEAEKLTVGQAVRVMRVTTDSQDIILTKWWEPAFIVELRNFDALVEFQDGTKSSSGLGLEL